jgi:hypothetical protein
MRKVVVGKTEKKRMTSVSGVPLVVRANRSMIVALDRWIKKQKPQPTRAEALWLLAKTILGRKPREKKLMDPSARARIARLFLNDANNFREAGIGLPPSGLFGPKNYLLCHSVELAMKAYLLATGSTLDDVEEIGHDLKKLNRLCGQRGLILSHPSACQNLAWIAPAHKEHSLRYARPGGITMPGDIEFNQFSLSVIKDVTPAVREAENAVDW